MKRFVSILCCLAMVLVSIPFSVSATEESIDFTAEFISVQHVSSDVHNSDSNWSKLRVLDTADECAEFVDNACTDSMGNVSTNISEYFATVPDSFFDENVILAFVLTLPHPGYELEVRDISVENGVMAINIDRWISDSDRDYPDCLDFYAVLIALERSDLNGVSSYNVVMSEVPADATEKSIDFTAETVYVSYSPDLDEAYVLNNAEEQAEFINTLSDYNPYIDEYFEALPADFYTTKALVVVLSYMPSSSFGGYEFDVRSVKKNGDTLTIELDWWETNLDQGKDDAMGLCATMIAVDKGDIEDVTSVDVIRTDLRGNLAENPKFFKADNFPDEAFEGNFDDGLLYIIDNAAKADEFVALGFSAGYNQPEVGDYFDSLADDFFEEKVILTVVFYSGCPDHTFSNARITKVDGVMTMVYDCIGPEDGLGYPTVPEYYINTVEMDKDLLNDVTDYSIFKKDLNASQAIDFTGHIFDVEAVDGYPAPVVITNENELADLLANYDSPDFAEYAEGLADDFFSKKILVVAYSTSRYITANYAIDDIMCLDGYSDLLLLGSINVSNAQRGNDTKLFVYELDDNFKNSNFHFDLKQNNMPGLFSSEDITIGLSSLSYVMLKRNYFATFDLDALQSNNADVNKNGKIDPMDYMLIKRCYFGTYAQMDTAE